MDTEHEKAPNDPPNEGEKPASPAIEGESAALPVTEDMPPVATLAPAAQLTPTVDAPAVTEMPASIPFGARDTVPASDDDIAGLTPALPSSAVIASPAAPAREPFRPVSSTVVIPKKGTGAAREGESSTGDVAEPSVSKTAPLPKEELSAGSSTGASGRGESSKAPVGGAESSTGAAGKTEVSTGAGKAESPTGILRKEEPGAPDLSREDSGGPEGGPTPNKAPPRRRWWLRALVAIFALVLAAGGVIVVFGPGYARGRIEEEARARGVVLAFTDVDLGLSRIRLHGVRVALSGVREFEASASWIDVDIVDGQPTSISAEQLAISMAGTEVLSELGAWKNEHAAALSAPLSSGSATVEWRPSSREKPALAMSGATLIVDPQKGSIEATTAQLVGRNAGPVTLSWTSTPEGFTVQIDPKAPPLSAAHIEVRSTKDGPRVKLTLARTALGPLQDALGIPKGSESMQVDGEVEMPVPSIAKPAPVEGSLRLSVKGYTPPHPRELDGILFGDTTHVKSRFVLAPDFESAKLESLTAEAGALSLNGSGQVVRDGLDAHVTMKLKGSIPCTQLATSAAVARLGSGLGRLAGGLAAGALSGSVAVSLTVDAHASDIKGAKITQSASVGCKVSVPGLPTIVIK